MQSAIPVSRLGHENDYVRLTFGVEPHETAHLLTPRFLPTLSVRWGEVLVTAGRLSALLTWPVH